MHFGAVITILLLWILKTAAAELENVEKLVEAVQKDELVKNFTFVPLRDSYVVKLAIFGDVDFGKRFNQSDEQILKYWQAVMYDVHLRFQTLSSVNISFQVTSLTTFKTPDEQMFVEKSRDENGTYTLHNVGGYADHWTYSKLAQLPVFDIAVFQLSFGEADKKYEFAVINGDTVCRGKQDNDQKWQATSIQSNLQEPAQRLAYNLARTLGFPNDNSTIYQNTCKAPEKSENLCCILGEPNDYRDIRSFSQCTDKYATFWGSSPNISGCLTKAADNNIPVIDTNELFHNPSKVPAWTLEEQCQIFMNDTKATAIFGFCGAAFCVSTAGSKFKYDMLIPHEGSKCGYKNFGRCVRGDCVQPQFLLVHVATDKCLVPEKSMFAIDDQPVLRNCSEIPIDQLDDSEMGDGIIKWLYSTNNGVSMKQLELDTDFKLKFSKENDYLRSSWMFDKLGNQEFLLKNSATGSCIQASDNGFNVEIVSSCSAGDKAARWKLVKIYEHPADFLRNIVKGIKLLFKRFSRTLRYWVSK